MLWTYKSTSTERGHENQKNQSVVLHIMLQAVKWLMVWVFLVLKPPMNGIPTGISEACVCRNLLLYEKVLTSNGDVDSCIERCRSLANYTDNPSTINKGTSLNILTVYRYVIQFLLKKICHMNINDLSCAMVVMRKSKSFFSIVPLLQLGR